MLAAGGATLSGNRIAMTERAEGGVAGQATANAAEGINAINASLSAGKPIIVGVDYKQADYNDDKLTDHFIIIVGSSTTTNADGSLSTVYHFYDPATSRSDIGTSSSNTLSLNDGKLTGTFAGNGNNYTVTTVRTNYL
jgi:hypothetical protein